MPDKPKLKITRRGVIVLTVLLTISAVSLFTMAMMMFDQTYGGTERTINRSPYVTDIQCVEGISKDLNGRCFDPELSR